MTSHAPIVGLMQAAIRMATPITFTALGGTMAMQTGSLNIALEGMTLTAAFFAVVGSYRFANAFIGLLAGVAASVALALLYCFFVVDLKGNTFVIGFALNMLASGGTVYLLRLLFGVKGAFVSPDIRPMPMISIGGPDADNLISSLFDNHSILTYVSWIAVVALFVLFSNTVFGLRLRAVGESPGALETAGVSTRRMMYLAYLGSGVLCGLAGTHLSLGYLEGFAENMVAGRGFIGLAAAIFGQGRPGRVFLGCILFGAADALAIYLQGLSIPPYFAQMSPYIVTIVALWLVSRPKHLARRPQ